MAQPVAVTQRRRRMPNDEEADPHVIAALAGYITNDNRVSNDSRVRNEQSELLSTRVDQGSDAYRIVAQYMRSEQRHEHAYNLTRENRELAHQIVTMGVEVLYSKLSPVLLNLIASGMLYNNNFRDG